VLVNSYFFIEKKFLLIY